MNQPSIQVYEHTDDLYRAAAAVTARHIRTAIDERGRALIALSGGSLATRLYPLLAGQPFREQIDWQVVSIVFADERYVPFDDVENNYRATRQTFLDHVPVQSDHIFPIPTYYRDPEQAAMIYQQQVRALLDAHDGQIDVVLLGMGPDGHTASLFPHHPSLKSITADALTVVVPDAPKPPPLRLSLTPAALSTARLMLFVVSGADKAAAVAAALAETGDPLAQPTRLVRPTQGQVIWMLDQAAGGQLR
ncbi:MAG: 6-phosphogluconolactonase [Chloroflexus sp.]|nr:6-phosphogluconolactonase [Chloroflexus sp.]